MAALTRRNSRLSSFVFLVKTLAVLLRLTQLAGSGKVIGNGKGLTLVLAIADNFAQTLGALRAHKLRASLTMLGLTMGVATLITVMTIVQGANLYVENKIANLG